MTVCCPIYPEDGVRSRHEPSADDAKKRAKQVCLVKRMIDTYYPDAIGSKKGSIR